MSTSTGNTKPKDQYQHYIPRFILRCFQDAQIQQRSKKQSQKDYYQARKTGVSNDTIAVYDLKTQVLEQRPIARTYGVINIYRDEQNPANVNHLEEALAKLENSAARSIREIQKAIEGGKGEVKLLRRELETIRKFLYIMHYRRAFQIPSYFDENDPDNVLMRDFYKTFRERHNLEGDAGVWLWGLKYILNTPHHKIVETGERLRDQYGGLSNMLKMLQEGVDPQFENFHALDYYLEADATFLAIWIAAKGQQFVVGTNSFGLFEGCFMGIPGLHYLHVVSPTIALVLRSNRLSPEVGLLQSKKGRQATVSLLAHVPTARPLNTYASFHPQRYPTMQLARAALEAYRRTSAAEKDTYTFFPSKLTIEQTQDFNLVLLSHLDMGSVTFASAGAMRASLKHQLQSTLPYIQESKYFLRPLLGLLSPDTVKLHIDDHPDLLAFLTTFNPSMVSAYDNAYMFYHLYTDHVDIYNRTSVEIHTMTARAIIKMKALLPASPTIERHIYFPSYNRQIVPTLTSADSTLFFNSIRCVVDILHVNTSGPTDDEDVLKYYAAIIGFTHWLAENHPSFLDDLLPDSLTIMSKPPGHRTRLVQVIKTVFFAIYRFFLSIIGFIARLFCLGTLFNTA